MTFELYKNIMKYNPNNKVQINNNVKNESNSGFFQSIYRYLVNLIKKNSQENDYELNKKLNESITYYSNYYKNEINYHVENPYLSKTGIINLLNDCYIISFLQILFHTENFLNSLKEYYIVNRESIINYLIIVSEYPFNVEYFYKLKQLFGIINPDYSKPLSNDSQEFGIDLINYLISETKEQIPEINNDVLYDEKDFNIIKKLVYKNYISTYQKKLNSLEKLFLFNQIDIFCGKNYQNPTISSNLHLELSLQKFTDYTDIESLIDQKYNNKNDNPKDNQIIIKSKIISLPDILIITINRVLNNKNINNTRLLFKENLDLKKYIDFDLFQDNSNKTTYHLYAINECVHSYRFSHYKCYIKFDNKWLIFDDEKPIKEFYGNFRDSPFIVGLFYKRDI